MWAQGVQIGGRKLAAKTYYCVVEPAIVLNRYVISDFREHLNSIRVQSREECNVVYEQCYPHAFARDC